MRRASASFGVLAPSVLVVEERRGWVEGVRTGKADGMEVVSLLGVVYLAGDGRNTAAATWNSGELFAQPHGTKQWGTRGEMERVARGLKGRGRGEESGS